MCSIVLFRRLDDAPIIRLNESIPVQTEETMQIICGRL